MINPKLTIGDYSYVANHNSHLLDYSLFVWTYNSDLLNFSTPLFYHKYIHNSIKYCLVPSSNLIFIQGTTKIHKKIGVPKHPHSLNPLAKFAVLVYNQVRNRRILKRPTVGNRKRVINFKKANGLQAILYCSRR